MLAMPAVVPCRAGRSGLFHRSAATARAACRTPDDQALAEAASLGIGEVALHWCHLALNPGPGEEKPSGEADGRDDGFLQLGGRRPGLRQALRSTVTLSLQRGRGV
jgi:hypothetical protein